MYHTHPPTGWIDWDGPLRPRCFDLNRLISGSNSPWDAAEVLFNDQVRYRFWVTEGRTDRLVRNGDGDDLLFVHEGAGEFFCDYGHLSIRRSEEHTSALQSLIRNSYAAFCLKTQ